MRIPIPEKVRRIVINRANGRCEECGRIAILELHHLTYRRNTLYEEESIFGHEAPEDLRALCRECHLSQHVDLAGNFWADPDEKRAFWESYELDKD